MYRSDASAVQTVMWFHSDEKDAWGASAG